MTGRGSVVDSVSFHKLLSDLRNDQNLTVQIFETASRVGLTDESAEWAIGDIEAGILGSDEVAHLKFGRNASRVSNATGVRLIQTIAGIQTKSAAVTALNLLMDRIEIPGSSDPSREEILLDLLSQLSQYPLSGMDEHIWELASQRALNRGYVKHVADSSLNLLNLESHDYHGQSGWKILLSAIKMDSSTSWKSMAYWLERSDPMTQFKFSLGAQEPRMIDAFKLDDVSNWIGSSTARAETIGRMAAAHESPLNELARWLLITFGAEGSVADVLTSRAHSTPGALWGPVSNFAKTQMEMAAGWTDDPDKNVAEWAEARRREFKKAYDADLAREEHRDLRNN